MIKNDEGVIPLLALIIISVIAFMVLIGFFFKWLIIGVLLIVGLLVVYGLTTGKMKGGKSTLMILAVAMVVIMVAIFGGLLPLTIISIDTKTKEISYDNGGAWGHGFGLWGGKIITSTSAVTYESGEIFDKEAYAVSWKPGVESEKIIMYGGIDYDHGPFNYLNDFRYNLYWSDDGVNWGSPIETWPMEDTYPGTLAHGPPREFIFFGQKPNGAIRVELTADSHGGWFGDYLVSDYVYAYDQAYIYQGAGDIEILNENKIVAVGEDVLIDVVHLGYSAGRGWTLELFSYPQNKVIESWSLSDGDVGVYKYRVTSSDWIGWSGCDDPQSSTPNRLEARLFNNIWKQDEADADTIDLRANAPPQPEVTTDKEYYNVNDTVKITINGIRNEDTDLELCYFLIDVYYQPGLIQLEDDTQVTAVQDSATYETDPLPQAGTIRVEVAGYDAGGHPSEHTILQKSVQPPGGGPPPPWDPASNDFWIFIILIIVVVGLIGYIAYKKFRRK